MAGDRHLHDMAIAPTPEDVECHSGDLPATRRSYQLVVIIPPQSKIGVAEAVLQEVLGLHVHAAACGIPGDLNQWIGHRVLRGIQIVKQSATTGDPIVCLHAVPGIAVVRMEVHVNVVSKNAAI